MLKYLEIKNDIKNKIMTGEFAPGDKIYSESELKKQYEVSNTTVVRAIQELVNEGYLTRRQGTGTFVRKAMLNKEVLFNEYANPPKSKGGDKKSESTKVVSVFEITNEEIAKKLEVDKSEKIVHFVRMRYINDEPWSVQNTYIAKRNLEGIDLQEFQQFTSLSTTIKSLLGIDILNESMNEQISIAFPAPNIVKEQLDFESDLPVYHIQRITFYPESTPFEYIETFIHYEYYSIGITRHKK